MPARSRLLSVLLATAAVLAALASALLSGCGNGTSQTPGTEGNPGGFDGAALPAGIRAPEFALRDAAGAGTVSLRALHGRPVLIAFPYTACRSCGLVMQQIRGALDELEVAPAVLLISADPASDSQAAVRAFLGRFSLAGRARYLTGTPGELRAVWRAYHVRPAAAGAATYAKYSTVVLIDGRGYERVLYGLEQLTPETLAHDIRKLENG